MLASARKDPMLYFLLLDWGSRHCFYKICYGGKTFYIVKVFHTFA